MAIFSLIYCLLPLLLIPINIYIFQKRELLTWEIKKGKICYHCKDDLNLSDYDVFKRLLDTTNHSKLCTVCSRDIKIDSIKNPLISFKTKFHKYLISEKYNKLNIYFLISSFTFILIDVILVSLFKIKIPLFLIYGTLNYIYWFIVIYKNVYTSKKPSK